VYKPSLENSKKEKESYPQAYALSDDWTIYRKCTSWRMWFVIAYYHIFPFLLFSSNALPGTHYKTKLGPVLLF